MKDYYALLKKIRKIDESPDNDLEYFRPKTTYRPRNIQPSDYTYHDYYYNYMKMDRNLTLHDDFINYCDADDAYDSPWKNKKRGVRVIGQQKRFGNQNAQPLFDEDLLSTLRHYQRNLIYSKRNK